MNTARLSLIARRLLPRSLRNWLRNPAKTASQAWRKVRFAAGQVGVVDAYEGWTVRCHPCCVEAFEKFKTDPDQRAELAAFAQHYAPGMQFLDLGAHWGFLSLAALHFGGKSAQSVAVEPSEAAGALLKVNLELNAETRRSTVLNKAVGQAPGSVAMLTTGANGDDYFIVPTENRPDVCMVAQTTIDEICDGDGYKPTHVKIDVEGYEEEVILGGKKFLTQSLPKIFLELHGNFIRARGRQPDEPLRLLEDYGYRHFERDGCPVTRQQLSGIDYIVRLVCLPDPPPAAR